jgi:hypothetical protein
MSFNLDEFTYIVSIVGDAVSMLDDSKVSVATTVESNEDDPDESWIVLNLSFPLKNGSVEMSIGDDCGVAKYYNEAGTLLLKEIEFDDVNVKEMTGSFNLAFKGMIAADKQNKQAKSTPNVLSGDSEMNKLRAQLSGIN